VNTNESKHQVDAHPDADGQVWFCVRDLCEAIGIDPDVPDDPSREWYDPRNFHASDRSGRPYTRRFQSRLMIRREAVGYWLITVDENEIADQDIRAEVKVFQENAAAALYRYCVPIFGGVAELLHACLVDDPLLKSIIGE